MLHCEILPGASHTGHDFVGNQQHALSPANLCHALQISRRRYYRTQSRTADWLENECGHLTIRGFNSLLKISRVLLPAIAATVGAVICAAVTIGERHMRELPHHRQIHLAPSFVSRNR